MKFSKNPVGSLVGLVIITCVAVGLADIVLNLIAAHLITIVVAIILVVLITIVVPRALNARGESKKGYRP